MEFVSPIYPIGVLPEKPTLVETIAYQVNGLIVVLLALGMIWGLMEVIGLIFRNRQQAPAPVAAASASAPAESITVGAPEAVPDHVTVIIAAAVATVLRGKPHRIHAIATASEIDWAREGRRQIFASHKVR